jgi:hypothetical protein
MTGASSRTPSLSLPNPGIFISIAQTWGNAGIAERLP